MNSEVDRSGASSACALCPEFLPMWRKGYGPTGGDNAGRRVWLKYLDEMDKDDYIDMITDVTVVDRNATCALCPEFLPFWEKGYGPEGGDKATRKVWRNYLDGINRADYIRMMDDMYTELINPPSSEEPVDPEIWGKYIKQSDESQGFDIVDYPGGSVAGGIVPAFSDMNIAKFDKDMLGFSIQALKVYNDREGTDFTLYMVLKANKKCTSGVLYYITFVAIDPYDCLHVFQANVADTIENPKEVHLVRPKPNHLKNSSELEMEADASYLRGVAYGGFVSSK